MALDARSIMLTFCAVMVMSGIAGVAYDLGKSSVFAELKNYGCEKVLQLHEKTKRPSSE